MTQPASDIVPPTSDIVPPTEDEARPILMHARAITKRFGGLVAVNSAELVIPQGSIVSLIGPNGAGKTTFFNVVAGILDPSDGEILFRGRKMVARPERAWIEPFVWFIPAVLAILVLLPLQLVIAPENPEMQLLVASLALGCAHREPAHGHRAPTVV